MRKLTIALVAALAAVSIVATTVTAHWPVASRYSRLSQGYHAGHRALDIAANYGTYVMSYSTGTTVYTGWRNNCGGYQVWTYNGRRPTDGARIYTAYYHLSRIHSYRGEPLSIGEVIGRVGTSGCTTGPHVHMEMWVGYPWARGSYRINPRLHLMHGTWLPYRYR